MKVIRFLLELIYHGILSFLKLFLSGFPIFSLLNEVIDSVLKEICVFIRWLNSELEHKGLLNIDNCGGHDVSKLFLGSQLIEELLLQQNIEQC